MKMLLEKYLGVGVLCMLQDLPFKNWPFEKSYENDLEQPIVQYVFKDRGLELRCDREERISVIFLYPDKVFSATEELFELPFSSGRARVLDQLGLPSKSGGKTSNPILGEFGAWDRFSRQGYKIHVEYKTMADCIAKITLMRNDVAPI